MAAKPTTGHDSVFRGKIKDKTGRIAGYLTAAGIRAFARRRREVSKWTGIPIDSLSQADVIEAVFRGEDETRQEVAAKG
jgi:hypothetical protein